MTTWPDSFLRAPFPYFGGKSRAAPLVWERLGQIDNYVEPFCGSCAMLLSNPRPAKIETVNDADCYLVNFWRAVRSDPEAVARWADWPVSECDQNARHLWLLGRADLRERMNTDPDYCEPKAAGWWVWGQNVWIGTGWCAAQWWRDGNAGKGVHRKLPHLGNAGTGVHRQLPHLGNAGTGVHRQLPHLGNAGKGVEDWMCALAERLRRVRIACGDWRRVCGPSVTFRHGTTGVFLDPPYHGTTEGEYAVGNGEGVAAAARAWAIEQGNNPDMRIALCGYAGDNDMPSGWTSQGWRARKGYQKVDAAGNHSGHNERVWFSPYCVHAAQEVFDLGV